jgi:CheY-like chemotaxis protein
MVNLKWQLASLHQEVRYVRLQVMALRCLIVDDNSEFLAAASGLLEGQGLEVVGTAQNGAEAMELAAQLRPDVILVDVYLGDENGFAVARQLGTSVGAGDRAIIMISTYAETDLRDSVESSVAKGFLSKTQLSAAVIYSLLGQRTA